MIDITKDNYRVGDMLWDKDYDYLHKILKVYNPSLSESWGQPTVVLIEMNNGHLPQKLSYDTLSNYKIVNKEDDPELFL